MNRAIRYIVLMATTVILACDTSSNIEPLNENFFIKWYAGVGVGDQFGNDIIATSDNGLLIAGTSVNNVDNTKEIIVVKTDNKGNELWTYGASANLGLASISVARSIIELPGGNYVVGGTLGEGDDRQSILIELSLDGSFANSAIISTDEPGVPSFNQISKITLGYSGILVSGETSHTASVADGVNGFISLYDFNLAPVPRGSTLIHYFGLNGDDVITGAYEVLDTAKFGPSGTRFLAFGSALNLDPLKGYDFFFIEFNTFSN